MPISDWSSDVCSSDLQNNKTKLSNAAMETLSIIAYQQPITKSGVEQIRGVNCDYSIQKLLEKDLITIAGKSDAPGRPILYATRRLFMDYFQLNTIEDLPRLKDIQPRSEERRVGQESVRTCRSTWSP